jgi:hypothetical protein
MMSPELVRQSLQQQGRVSNGGIFEPGHADAPTPSSAFVRQVGGGSFGGGGGTFGGGGVSMPSINFPAFQMPEIRIPTYTPPTPPPVTRLTYEQLLARIQNDPGYLQEKAGINQTRADALSALTAQEGLVRTDLDASLQKLGRAEDSGVESLMEEMAGSGALRSSITPDREGRLRAGYQEQRGDYQRAANQTLSGLMGQRSSVTNQSEQNATTARQNAINRYLSTRVNPTEVIY